MDYSYRILLITACIPLELQRRQLTARKSISHVDFSKPSTIDMETQLNVSHQLRGLLPDLVNKQMSRNTCNKPSTCLYRKYVDYQMIFRTHCIVLKKDLWYEGPYFLTYERNIMPFFLLDSSWVYFGNEWAVYYHV